MGEYLKRQADKQKKVEKKKKDMKKSDISSDTYSGEGRGSSRFQLTAAPGGIQLWGVAQKKPGQLTRLALNEMTRPDNGRVREWGLL